MTKIFNIEKNKIEIKKGRVIGLISIIIHLSTVGNNLLKNDISKCNKLWEIYLILKRIKQK